MLPIVTRILEGMPTVSQPQRKFLVMLLSTMFVLRGKMTFTNLSRYSPVSEKTFRRQFAEPFDFTEFNRRLIQTALPPTGLKVAVIDGSFIPKSGKATYGRDWFYNGCAGRGERGLEITTIGVVEVANRRAFALATRQTPPGLAREPVEPKAKAKTRTKTRTKTKAGKPATGTIESGTAEAPPDVTAPPTSEPPSRVDWYGTYFQDITPSLPTDVRYLAADGYFAKRKFIAAVRQVGFHLVSKLRGDADLRVVFTGAQKPRGAPRKYDGKVDLTDVSRLDWVREIEPGVTLYTQVVWWMTTRTHIRIAYLRDTRDPKKVRHVVLFSTDPTLSAETILDIYRSRFQIEFLFRDGKQFAGLGDCQARSQTKLDFHFNASLTAVNVAKLEQQQALPPAATLVFSLDDHKRKAFNRFLLDEFISNFGLNPEFIKNHPNFEKLIHCGLIAA